MFARPKTASTPRPSGPVFATFPKGTGLAGPRAAAPPDFTATLTAARDAEIALAARRDPQLDKGLIERVRDDRVLGGIIRHGGSRSDRADTSSRSGLCSPAIRRERLRK